MSETELLRVGVVGWPVGHSRSPTIHRHWLSELGLAGSYERFGVQPAEFREFVARIGRDGLVGANITAPHKEIAYALCDRRTPVADALGAVNTVWREDRLLWGDNTDVAGFLANMDDSAPGWAERARSAVVIGAGGAARAIIYALMSRRFERIAIVNRTQARAETLAAQFGSSTRAVSCGAPVAELADADLLVNTTSLGMARQPPLVVDLRALTDRAVVADVVYVPLRTTLIEAARARDLRTAEGLGMLLHQAAPAFARWFGRKPTVTPALRALVEAEILATHEEGR
jgi:shikimate dehydrogenase